MQKKEEKTIKIKTVLAVSASLIFAGGAFYCGYKIGRKDGIALAQVSLMNTLTNGVEEELNKV